MTAPADAWARGLCPVCQRDSCDDLSHVPPDERKTQALPDSIVGDFLSAAVIAEERPPEGIIEDAVYRGGLTVLAGESGSGKSFVSLDASAAVAEGVPWHGRDAIRGSVAYVAFEADALPRRLQALERSGRTVEDLYILRAADPLSPINQRDGVELPSIGEEILLDRLQRLASKLEREARPPIVLLVVDTVRASLSGSEDSSSDVSAYLRAIRRILATLPEAGALLVHHTGWQDGEHRRKRERGSSAFRGNVEVTLYLEVADESDPAAVHLELRTLKARDSERRPALRLIRRRVDLPSFDHFGHPLSSCIIEQDPRSYQEVLAERDAAEAEAAQSQQDALDREVLAIIRDHSPSSQEVIRSLLGCNRPKAQAAVSRLLRGRLIEKQRHRDPFTLTDDGRKALL